MLAGPIGAMVLPLTDDASKVTKEILGHADFGHEYMEGDIKMVEFHEDYIDKAGMDLTQFEKKQSNLVGSNGERPLLPKSKGDGKMLSAFQSRLTGFGREMSTDELQKVNEQRLNKTYWDGEAALEVLKSTSKPPLTASPFVRKLLIGINNEGYWNSNHMAVQFEDVVDCLKVLYPSHEFVFLFDHSQGHNRKRKGALEVNNMNVSFGVGDTQRMNWSNEEPPEESTEGPFNLSVQERRKRRSTQLLDEYVNNKPKTKKELTTDLQREGIISKEDRRGYTVKEMQKLAGDHGIAISKSEQKKITGWVGEPKGLLQVARERGLIDHINHHLYSANPKKNPDGTLNAEKSLRSIVGQCTNFQNELTHLQVMADELKVQVMFTPKFHAEMAGEGIEYSWGFAKGSYRRKPLKKKRKRADFEDLVDECTNVETELTKARIRKFSARARAYLCTYHYLATAEPTAAVIEDNDQEKKQKNCTRGFAQIGRTGCDEQEQWMEQGSLLKHMNDIEVTIFQRSVETLVNHRNGCIVVDDELIASRATDVEQKVVSNRKRGKEGPVADCVACFLTSICFGMRLRSRSETNNVDLLLDTIPFSNCAGNELEVAFDRGYEPIRDVISGVTPGLDGRVRRKCVLCFVSGNKVPRESRYSGVGVSCSTTYMCRICMVPLCKFKTTDSEWKCCHAVWHERQNLKAEITRQGKRLLENRERNDNDARKRRQHAVNAYNKRRSPTKDGPQSQLDQEMEPTNQFPTESDDTIRDENEEEDASMSFNEYT
ncbi:hypothetical protein IV203_032804 [Nitzschia inconspicua]|uniref:Uncharacterized protein n=1 Tax=Nitzschia inconspicua TaxID=303405 RepID=A0A9K3KM04_9STRA|nr:hypothetical protein IV203_032804 [Nitzschia inconspicua]